MIQNLSNGADSKDLMELATLELERRFRSGEKFISESLFGLYPELAANPDSALEIIYLEHVLCIEAGIPSSETELCSRFPDFAEEIRKLIQVDSALRSSDTKVASLVQESRLKEPEFENEHEVLDRLGDYDLLERIGHGGMGIVYRARQRSLNREVAVKTIDQLASLSPQVLSRFQAESAVSARLQHPNIVQVFEVGNHRGMPYFSMELIRGGSLAEAIASRTLEFRLAARIVAALSNAIAHAHAQGVVHRDLKPNNILLAPSKDPDAIEFPPTSKTQSDTVQEKSTHIERFELKIADFGLAKYTHSVENATVTGVTLGTPSYMAPEQIESPTSVDYRCDIYGLGCILYTILVGRPPFQSASPIETLRQVRFDEPQSPRQLNSKIPIDLETICLKCLRKDASRRYSSAEELSKDLELFLDAKPITARPVHPGERVAKWAYRHPSLAALIVAMICSSLGMTMLWLMARSSQVAEREQRVHAELLVGARDMRQAQLEYERSNIDGCREILAGFSEDKRHWEWHYLNQLCDRALWESPRSSQSAITVDISPDDRYVAKGHGRWGFDHDQKVEVWDIVENRLVWQFVGHPPSQICDVNFRPNGKDLLSTAVVWGSKRKGEPLGGVRVWDLSNGTARIALDGINAYVARYHPDGNSFLVGSTSGVISQHDSETGEVIRTFPSTHKSMILDMRLSADGKRLAVSSRNGICSIWNMDSEKPLHVLKDMGDPRQIVWSPSGNKLLIGGYSGATKWFDLNNEDIQLVHVDSLHALPYMAFSPDGRWLARAELGSGVEIRDAQIRKEIQRFYGHAGHVRDLQFNANGSLLVTCGQDGKALVWDTKKTPEFPRVTNLPRIGGQDSEIVAVDSNAAMSELAIVQDRSNDVEIRDIQTMKSLWKLAHSNTPTCLKYSPDGKRIITGSQDGQVYLWSTSDGTRLSVIENHQHPLVGVGFMDQGKMAVSADRAGNIKIWNTVDHETKREWNVGEEIRYVAAHATQPVLAVALEGKGLCIWNTSTGKQEVHRNKIQCTTPMRFSSDGKRFAYAFNELLDAGWESIIEVASTSDLLDQRKSTPPVRLKGHTADITGFAFSPDGLRIVSVSDDESTRLFDVTVGSELYSLGIEKGGSGRVLFSHDGTSIVRAVRGSISTWSIHLEKTKKPSLDSVQSKKSMLAWHARQLKEASYDKDYFAMAYHQSELIKLEPENKVNHSNRATTRLALGDWEGAEHDFLEGLTEKNAARQRSLLARIYLRNGRMDEYREQCQLIRDAINDTQDPESVNSAAWICCLTTQSGIPAKDFIPLFNKAIATSKGKRATYYNTLALVHYRAGDKKMAMSYANQSLKEDLAASAPMDWMILALCTASTRAEFIKNPLQDPPLTTLQSLVKSPSRAHPETYISAIKKGLEQQIELAHVGAKTSGVYRMCRQLELPILAAELEELMGQSLEFNIEKLPDSDRKMPQQNTPEQLESSLP